MAKQGIPGFNAKLGVTYRILMPYKGEQHILQRLQLCKDVSLYLFNEKRKTGNFGQATIPAGEPHVDIDITKGSVEDNPSEHISFHGSGVVNTPFHESKGANKVTRRAIGHPLRILKEQVQICSILFPHLSKLPTVRNSSKYDITINYPLDENCPLVLDIFATPRSKASQIKTPNAIFEFFYAFVYEHILDMDDLVIILDFYHSPGEWIRDKVIVYPHDVRQFKNKTP